MSTLADLYNDLKTLGLQMFQEKLISGTNIKTINNQSLLGSGNISVGGSGGGLSFDDVYPVGSIYMSVNSVNPSTLFGGTWEQIEDKFLLASGTNYSNGSTGGEATHTLTTDEMPSHTHTQSSHRHHFSRRNVYVASGNGAGALGHLSDPSYGDYYTDWQTPTIDNEGGGQAHNNMPPYLAVNVWKRTA